jgi:ribonuclease HI
MDAQLPRGRTVLPSIAQVHFDGACQPPHARGIATYGFTIEGPGLEYEEKGLAVPPFSESATNNVAEYVGAIRALEHLRALPFLGQLLVLGDSELVIKQMNGEYSVQSERLLEYHRHLKSLCGAFAEVRWVWIPREENQRADELSKEAILDARSDRAARRNGARAGKSGAEGSSER